MNRYWQECQDETFLPVVAPDQLRTLESEDDVCPVYCTVAVYYWTCKNDINQLVYDER